MIPCNDAITSTPDCASAEACTHIPGIKDLLLPVSHLSNEFDLSIVSHNSYLLSTLGINVLQLVTINV